MERKQSPIDDADGMGSVMIGVLLKSREIV
jgi:hypothetical protein